MAPLCTALWTHTCVQEGKERQKGGERLALVAVESVLISFLEVPLKHSMEVRTPGGQYHSVGSYGFTIVKL